MDFGLLLLGAMAVLTMLYMPFLIKGLQIEKIKKTRIDATLGKKRIVKVWNNSKAEHTYELQEYKWYDTDLDGTMFFGWATISKGDKKWADKTANKWGVKVSSKTQTEIEGTKNNETN